jgi:hypothetical protein
MRATSPAGAAEFEGTVQWSGELGFGVRSPEGGQSAHRDDASTGSKQLRDTLERHLLTEDLPAAKRGPRGAIGRMLEKAERFAPGAAKKHREKADTAYAAAVVAGNAERDQPGTAAPVPGAEQVPGTPSAAPGSDGA